MGGDWLYKASGGGDGGKSPSAVAGKNTKKAKYKNTSSPGCMSAIYNLFDIQHHQFRYHHPSFMSSESTITDNIQPFNFPLQGIEAPRNSLDSPESAIKVTPSSPKANEQRILNIPVSRIKIKTNRSNFSDDLLPETCICPGTKTPNLVARLMGLDILPEYSSPRPSSSSTTANSDHRSRSLPTTPRLSSASRKSTDSDYHHRLSLQIDKENNKNWKEMISRRRSSRRVGTDITNTVSPARIKCQRRDLNLVKPPAIDTTGKTKVRLLDIKGNINKPVSNSRLLSMEEVKVKTQILGFRQTPLMKQKKVVNDEKIKRMASERYGLRLKKMNQQEKVFDSNKKSTARKLTCVKRETTSSCSSTTQLSQKQVSLPSNLNSSYNSNDTHNLKTAATTTSGFYGKFPAADCEVFERDMRRSMRWLVSTAFVAEVEDMVVEIEREILNNLVHEIAMETVAPAGSDRLTSHVPM